MLEHSNPEKIHQNPISLTFNYNSYETSPDDIEFLFKLRQFLKANGLENYSFFFRGADGNHLDQEISEEQKNVFGMNQAGWVKALNEGEPNPANYADFQEKFILVYDADQLVEIYGGKMSIDPNSPEEKAIYSDFELGDPLKDSSVDHPVQEGVVHIEYPNISPNSCLLAIVKIEEE
jgi:hypothetical protein